MNHVNRGQWQASNMKLNFDDLYVAVVFLFITIDFLKFVL